MNKIVFTVNRCSRREFVVAVAGTAVTLFSPPVSEASQVSLFATADLHYHVLPPITRQTGTRQLNPLSFGPVEPWNPREAIASMDVAGIQAAILSMPISPLLFVDARDYRSFVRACNEYAARVSREYSSRFGFFASVPLPDVAAAVDEIDYACDVLKPAGIFVSSSYGIRRIGDSAFTPVLRAIDRRGMAVCVHPPGAKCCKALSRYLPYGEEEPDETQHAVASLRSNAALAELRRIRFLLSHRPDNAGPFSSDQL